MLWFLFALAAGIATIFGIMSLTPATLGVGIIGIACLLGILARLAQAAEYQKSIRRMSGETAELEALRAELKEAQRRPYTE